MSSASNETSFSHKNSKLIMLYSKIQNPHGGCITYQEKNHIHLVLGVEWIINEWKKICLLASNKLYSWLSYKLKLYILCWTRKECQSHLLMLPFPPVRTALAIFMSLSRSIWINNNPFFFYIMLLGLNSTLFFFEWK